MFSGNVWRGQGHRRSTHWLFESSNVASVSVVGRVKTLDLYDMYNEDLKLW